MARVLGNNKEKLVFLWFFAHFFVSLRSKKCITNHHMLMRVGIPK